MASGQYKLSKKNWEEIGRQAGWIKIADDDKKKYWNENIPMEVTNLMKQAFRVARSYAESKGQSDPRELDWFNNAERKDIIDKFFNKMSSIDETIDRISEWSHRVIAHAEGGGTQTMEGAPPIKENKENAEPGVLDDERFMSEQQAEEFKNDILDQYNKGQIDKDKAAMMLREFASKIKSGLIKIA